MIKRLKRRFVVIAASATALVMLVIMLLVNAVNYTKVVNDADRLLDVIVENGGKISVPIAPTAGRYSFFSYDPHLNVETPFSTRFFTVVMDQEGKNMALDLTKIAAVGVQEAKDYALEARNTGRERGFVGYYRYCITQVGANTMIVFLDCAVRLHSVWDVLYFSIVVAVVGLAVVTLLLCLCAERAILPIANSYNRQRRFITDASHELKTPLTVIGANTEVLEMAGGENQWTESIRNQVDRLTALTERLVMLSRMDEENDVLMSDFSLSDAVSESVEPYFALARSQDKVLSVDIEKHMSCFGSEENIRRLTGILMENAFKYSGEKGHVRVSLRPKGKSAVITVTNTAPGVAKGRHEEYFRRFYRADAARTGSGGFGLGLSIAGAIVAAHKGRITAYSHEENELTLTVTL